MVRREPCDDALACEVYDGERVRYVLRDVQESPVARDRQSGGKTCAVLLRLLLSQEELINECGATVAPTVTEDRVLVAARDVERLAVGREGQAEESRWLRERLHNVSRRALYDLDALLAPAAQRDDKVAPIRRELHRERHVAHIERAPGSIQPGSRREASLCALRAISPCILCGEHAGGEPQH